MDAATEIVNRVLAELSVAKDWREVVACANRFNIAIADLPALARERLIERFRDVARERNSHRT